MFVRNICFAALILIISTIFLGNIAMANISVPSLTVEELVTEQKEGKKPLLLDVRTDREFEANHIKGATHIPLSELPTRLSEVPKDKDVVVYCRSGARSSRAIRFLAEHGFSNLRNLTGGMLAWHYLCDDAKGIC